MPTAREIDPANTSFRTAAITLLQQPILLEGYNRAHSVHEVLGLIDRQLVEITLYTNNNERRQQADVAENAVHNLMQQSMKIAAWATKNPDLARITGYDSNTREALQRDFVTNLPIALQSARETLEAEVANPTSSHETQTRGDRERHMTALANATTEIGQLYNRTVVLANENKKAAPDRPRED